MQLLAMLYVTGGLFVGATIHPVAALAWFGTPVAVSRLA